MDWMTEVGAALWISSIYLFLFGSAELFRGIGFGSQEFTRKYVHLIGGLVSLSFSYVFSSHWTLLVMCLGFVVFMRGAKWLGLLHSVHGVKRTSSGDILHPIAMYMTFVLAQYFEQPVYYVISILVLSVSDTLAALIGKSYGFKQYFIEEESKSIEGSLMFFLSTFIMVHLCLLLLTHTGRVECVLIALLLSVLLTCFEALSMGGADNLFIPLGTLFILSKLSERTTAELLFRLSMMSMIFLIGWWLAFRGRRLGGSGVLGIAMISYGALALVDLTWLLPIFICAILLAFTDLFLEKTGDTHDLVRIRPIFYMFIVSFGWIALANQLGGDPRPFLLPYLISFMGVFSIRWEWQRRLLLAGGPSPAPQRGQGGLTWRLLDTGPLGRALMLTLLFVPVQFIFYQLASVFSLVLSWLGILMSDRLYWWLGARFHGHWGRTAFLRMGMAVSVAVTLIVWLISRWWYIPG